MSSPTSISKAIFVCLIVPQVSCFDLRHLRGLQTRQGISGFQRSDEKKIAKFVTADVLLPRSWKSNAGGVHNDTTGVPTSRTQSSKIGHGNTSLAQRSKSGFGRIGLFIVFACVMFAFGYKAAIHYMRYKESPHVKGGFLAYLWYQFESSLTQGESPHAYIILFAVAATLFVGSFCYAFLTDRSFLYSLWTVFTWIVDPGMAVAVPLGNIAVTFLAGFMGILGLVLFGLLLMLMQERFMSLMQSLHGGRSQIIESDHVIIVGMTDSTYALVQELCEAHEPTGGVAIIVFSDKFTKAEMARKFQEDEVKLLGSRLIFCVGSPLVAMDLRHVGAETAKTIVLLPDTSNTKETSDAITLEVLSTLRTESWPKDGRILAVCSEVRNFPVFQEVGQHVADIVMLDHFVAQIMVQCSNHPGLNAIFNDLFGFSGSEMYVSQIPSELHDLTFSQATRRWRSAIPLGVADKEDLFDLRQSPPSDASIQTTSTHGGGPTPMSRMLKYTQQKQWLFCPGPEYRLSEGQEVVLLAEDENCLTPMMPEDMPDVETKLLRSTSLIRQITPVDDMASPEVIFFIGWNKFSSLLILELSRRVPANSSLVVLSTVPRDVRVNSFRQSQQNWKRYPRNFGDDCKNIQHVEGHICSRHCLEELPMPLSNASRIIIFMDDQAKDEKIATAWAKMASRHIQNLSIPENTHIIREFRDKTSGDECCKLKREGLLNTARLPSSILAMLCLCPHLLPALGELTSRKQTVRFNVRSLADYLAEDAERPRRVNFFQISNVVENLGDIAIGWTREGLPAFDDDDEGATRADYELNPPDHWKQRDWDCEVDRIVVLTKQQA